MIPFGITAIINGGIMNKKIIVIGGGPGGYAAALYASNLGAEVVLIEKNLIGGTCLNVGCIPTKAFVQASKAFASLSKMKKMGISVDGEISVDFSKTLKFKNQIVTQIRGGVSYLLSNNKVKVIQGTGKLLSPTKVEVSTEEGILIEEAENIILATGSSIIDLPNLKTDGENILNSTQMLDVEILPEELVIVGGGVIGVEFASILNAFGKKVTIVEIAENIIPFEDKQISEALEYSLSQKGVEVKTNTKVVESEIVENGVILTLEDQEGNRENLKTEKVLVSVGRKSNIDNLGLVECGINYNSKFIETNSKMQTSQKNIYAVGDITSSPQLAHLAYHEAQVAVRNIMDEDVEVKYDAIPSCIFSSPEVARVGLTEGEAKAKYDVVKVETESFMGNGKAMIEGEADGFIKLVLAEDKVVGCSIIGPKSTELIAEPSLAVTHNMSIYDFAKNINAHPSLSEIISETANAAIGLKLHSV